MNEGVVMQIEDALAFAAEQGNDTEDAAIELQLLRKLANECRSMRAADWYEAQGEIVPGRSHSESYRQLINVLGALDAHLGEEG